VGSSSTTSTVRPEPLPSAATGTASAVGAGAWTGWSGSTMMKLEPSPALLVTWIVPPSMLAKCLVMVSPSPVPP
jgi:hypothetical protein